MTNSTNFSKPAVNSTNFIKPSVSSNNFIKPTINQSNYSTETPAENLLLMQSGNTFVFEDGKGFLLENGVINNDNYIKGTIPSTNSG